MKFGVFLPNGSNGYIMSRNTSLFAPTFAHNVAISREAERHGMEFVLSMMKYRGFGGDTGYWDACLESLTLMAAIGSATSRIELFPSAALLSVHPAVMARMVATIDDVSGGRCGLNIVTGWNKPEYIQMGMWPGDEYFQRRYDYAAEYVDVLRLLWENGRGDFDGEFFQLEDCTVFPQPSRKIPIVCAGSSPRGMEFTAQYGDFGFTSGEPEAIAAIVKKQAAMGQSFGRQVGIYASFGMIIADSDAEAQAMYDHIAEGADLKALANMASSASHDSNEGGSAKKFVEKAQRSIAAGKLTGMTPTILGSPATVAAKIEEIAAQTGISGMLLSWPDFLPGVRMFGEKVLPRLKIPAAA